MNRFKNKQIAAAYVAGMIDGEGHVRHGLTKKGEKTVSRYKCITITNTDIGLLEACEEALDMLEIQHRRHEKPVSGHKDGHNRKPCFVTWIMGRDNLIKVQKLVPLQSSDKKQALDIAINSYQRIPGQKWKPSPEAIKTMSEGQRRRRERERLEKEKV